jgi:hypothetical protein
MTETRMVIAVDIKGSEEYQNFIHETFKRITPQHLQHTFIFIFDKPYDLSLVFSENVIPLIVSKAKASLWSQLTINHKISSFLKKYKTDVFLTSQILSGTKVPQCLVAFDSISAKIVKNAKLIIADSAFSKNEFVVKYKINPDKISIVYQGVEEICKPLLFQEKVNYQSNAALPV